MLTRGAPDGDEAVEGVVLAAHRLRRAGNFFSERCSTWDKINAHHELPPTPMTVMGEQVRPTKTLGATTIPRRPMRVDASPWLARLVLLPTTVVRKVAGGRKQTD